MNKNTPVITVKSISKSFRVPHENHSSLKQEVLNLFKRKSYEHLEALKDVSFEVNKGDFFGIVGVNGSGKSTLLKILAGIYPSDNGEISINGTVSSLIELGVGFNEELTARDNIYLNAAMLGVRKKMITAKFNEILKFAEVENFVDQKLKNFSSGMRIRLAFAIAVNAKADILILDEVLAVGDAAFQQKSLKFFKEAKKSNTTIVLVTHDMKSVQAFCDRALLIDNGTVSLVGNPTEVANKYMAANFRRSSKNANSMIKLNSVQIKKFYKKHVISIDFFMKRSGKIVPGITVVDAEGVYIAGINSRNYFKTHKFNEGANSITCEVDTSVLAKGEYFINVAFYKYKPHELLYFFEKEGYFFVDENPNSHDGRVILKTVWGNNEK